MYCLLFSCLTYTPHNSHFEITDFPPSHPQLGTSFYPNSLCIFTHSLPWRPPPSPPLSQILTNPKTGMLSKGQLLPSRLPRPLTSQHDTKRAPGFPLRRLLSKVVKLPGAHHWFACPGTLAWSTVCRVGAKQAAAISAHCLGNACKNSTYAGGPDLAAAGTRGVEPHCDHCLQFRVRDSTIYPEW